MLLFRRWRTLGSREPSRTTITIGDVPLRVGRSSDANLRINRQSVSSLHAELYQCAGDLWLRDRQSTNGKYVNGVPVTAEVQVADGDLVQFADAAFRVVRLESGMEAKNATIATSTYDEALALVQFDRLMNQKAVIPHFQPIVALPDLNVVGHEVLGRSRHYGLESPRDMFLAASQLNQEGERVAADGGSRKRRDDRRRPHALP